MSLGLLDKLKRELEIVNSSKKTVKSYIYYTERYLKFCGKIGINENSVKDFIKLEISKKNPSTVSSEISALKFFFNKVLRQKLELGHPKRNKTLPEILTPEEVRKMINSLDNVKHKLILKLLYGCGLRVGEIIHLGKRDINFEERLIHVKLAKGRKDRFVKIPESLINELRNYCELSEVGFLFGSNRGGKLTIESIQKIVKNSAKKAGITKRVYPHLLRHSFATHLLDQGTDLRIIQKLLGHSDVKTTQIYVQVSNQSIKNVRSPLDNILL